MPRDIFPIWPLFFVFLPLGSLVPGYVIKDAVEENYESDHDSWLLIMRYPHWHWIITVKNTKSFMKVFIVIRVHAWELMLGMVVMKIVNENVVQQGFCLQM